MDKEKEITYISTQNTRNRSSINGRKRALRQREHHCINEEKQLVNARDAGLIDEAIAVNHTQVKRARTLKDYARSMRHFAAYLASVPEVTVEAAKRRHVLAFMNHLRLRGGADPDQSRKGCTWCEANGYPDGRDGEGWSASRRKSYLSAIRFLYRYLIEEEIHLPNGDPSVHITSPVIELKHQFTPTRDQVRGVLDAAGEPRDRVLAYWMYYAPSRRETFRDAKWSDFQNLDTDDAFWSITKGKGDKRDGFALGAILRRELRRYKKWQDEEARTNPKVASALADERTAFVILTDQGRQIHATTLTKMIKWRGIRAEVGLIPSDSSDAVDGWSSKLTPHSLRRAWADHALNDDINPLPLDIVSGVLNHASTQTTINHYARAKRDRVHDAIKAHRL